jgi:hypothetical protein
MFGSNPPTLQDEVLALKARRGKSLRLTKSKGTPSSPFPLHVAAVVETPESAASFDIDSVTVVAILAPSFLHARADGLDVRLQSDVLPQVVRDAASRMLLSAWHELVGALYLPLQSWLWSLIPFAGCRGSPDTA